jgi:putative oxidoreductase
MKILNRLWAGEFAAYGLLALRVPVGVHLIHGTQDNVRSWTRMLEFRDFLAAEGFPVPLVCAVVSVAAQFVCGALYLMGYCTRGAAIVMLFNFTVALIAVHAGHPYAAAFPALMMWFGSLALLLSGPGAWSFDERRRSLPHAKSVSG